MPELTAAQIADRRALRDYCAALGADLVIIGAIAYQVHFPGELRHTGDIDFAVALDLNEFAELAEASTGRMESIRQPRAPLAQYAGNNHGSAPGWPQTSRGKADHLAREPVHDEPSGIRACFHQCPAG